MRIAEDYATLQHLADGRIDLMLGRGNTGPVYPWFGKDIRKGIALAIENYALLHRLWREDVVDWQGKFRTPLQGFTSTPRPLDGVPPFVWHGSIRSPGDRRAGRVLRRRLLRQPHLLAGRRTPSRWSGSTGSGSSTTATARADQAIVGLGGQVFMRQEQPGRHPRVPALLRQRAGLRARPVAGGLHRETPLTVGSPQQVIERTLGFRDYVGDYQRQLFLVDHAGLPLKTVLEQLDILGEEVVPVLRREFDALRARGRARRADARQPGSRRATPQPVARRRGPGGRRDDPRPSSSSVVV